MQADAGTRGAAAALDLDFIAGTLTQKEPQRGDYYLQWQVLDRTGRTAAFSVDEQGTCEVKHRFCAEDVPASHSGGELRCVEDAALQLRLFRAAAAGQPASCVAMRRVRLNRLDVRPKWRFYTTQLNPVADGGVVSVTLKARARVGRLRQSTIVAGGAVEAAAPPTLASVRLPPRRPLGKTADAVVEAIEDPSVVFSEAVRSFPDDAESRLAALLHRLTDFEKARDIVAAELRQAEQQEEQLVHELVTGQSMYTASRESLRLKEHHMGRLSEALAAERNAAALHSGCLRRDLAAMPRGTPDSAERTSAACESPGCCVC
eukprot:TRINITY_DN39816_c0_g1_i1.p1 TRINITY_DN39816_c0_g1~~TRINITY_DN39816_c0_g1_i1.p1  ORF type:complete len:318 (+),score=110.31 TRINITY_DN39816_c0_g1_i1:48-1001(+)